MNLRWTDKRGSVLILVMWTLVFLSGLAIAVASYVDAGLRVAGKMKSVSIGNGAARAGVESAIALVIANSNAWDTQADAWFANEDVFKDMAVGEGVCSITSVAYPVAGQAITNYGLTDEESLVNLNKADIPLLTSLFESAGKLDRMTAQELAASVSDWRDPDDVALTGGAENGYYRALELSYGCHNGDFQSIRELLLVKGMSYELFEKLEPYLTVFGSGRVNVNTAGELVLRSAARAAGSNDVASAELLAGKLVKFRAGGGAFRVPVPEAIVAQLKQGGGLTAAEESIFRAMMKYMTTQSTCFRGTAAGRYRNGSENGSVIDFVFDRQKGARLYWYGR